MAQNAFNTAAPTFSQTVAQAEFALKQNSFNYAPLHDIENTLILRGSADASAMLQVASPFKLLNGLSALVDRLHKTIQSTDVEATEQSVEVMTRFAKDADAELQDTATRLAESRDKLDGFRSKGSLLRDEVATFAEALDRLGKHFSPDAEEAELCHMLATTRQNAGTMLQNSLDSDAMMQSVQESYDEQLIRIKDLGTSINARRDALKNAVDLGYEIAALIDSCLTGIKTPMTVRKKPVSFKKPRG